MQNLIKKYDIQAKKSLGQNYLINEKILDKIVNSVEIYDQNILEIGPGFGALTEKIIQFNPKSLILVELDQKMIDILNDRILNGELDISKISKFEIIKNDILKYEIKLQNYLVLANIPYYITTDILFKFLYEVKNFPQEMVIMMQKDVAEKILNPKKNTFISLFIQKKCDINMVCEVSKNSFFPIPKVDSEVLLFELNDKFSEIDDKKFINFIKIGFKNPRKKLVNNLENGGFDKNEILKIFKKLEIDENIRGEDLDIQHWCNLTKELFR